MLDCYFNNIGRVDRTDDARPVKGPLAVGHAGGFEIRNDGEVLPDLAFQPVFGELFAQDGVALAERLQTVAVMAPVQRTPRPGPGNG